MRARPAPSESRIPSSRDRLDERASSSPATLVHAINSTRPTTIITIPKNAVISPNCSCPSTSIPVTPVTLIPPARFQPSLGCMRSSSWNTLRSRSRAAGIVMPSGIRAKNCTFSSSCVAGTWMSGE